MYPYIPTLKNYLFVHSSTGIAIKELGLKKRESSHLLNQNPFMKSLNDGFMYFF